MAEKEYIERGNIEKWLLTEMASLDTEEDRKFVVERIRGEIPAADVVELVRYNDNPFPQIELRYPSGYVFTITIPYEAVNHTTACLLDDIAVRVDWRKEHD